MHTEVEKVEYAIGTPHGGFRLIVPVSDGADGKPINPDKAADLILSRGFVRRDINAPRDLEPVPGPGLRLKYCGKRAPTRREVLERELAVLLEG